MRPRENREDAAPSPQLGWVSTRLSDVPPGRKIRWREGWRGRRVCEGYVIDPDAYHPPLSPLARLILPDLSGCNVSQSGGKGRVLAPDTPVEIIAVIGHSGG